MAPHRIVKEIHIHNGYRRPGCAGLPSRSVTMNIITEMAVRKDNMIQQRMKYSFILATATLHTKVINFICLFHTSTMVDCVKLTDCECLSRKQRESMLINHLEAASYDVAALISNPLLCLCTEAYWFFSYVSTLSFIHVLSGVLFQYVTADVGVLFYHLNLVYTCTACASYLLYIDSMFERSCVGVI